MTRRQDETPQQARRQQASRLRERRARGSVDVSSSGQASAVLSAQPSSAAPEYDAPVEAKPLAGPSLTGIGAHLRDLPKTTWNAIRGASVEAWAWVAVLFVGLLLRFWDLGAKPLHHDESMHAFYSLQFARDPSSYTYNPLLHGPFQFHAVGLWLQMVLGLQLSLHTGGPGNYPWINDATVRVVPALFGLGIVALPLGLRRELGRLGALLAGLLLAVSPSFVYFSRFLREDIYFNFFMFATVVCAVRFARSRKMVWLALTAASITLAYATFEGVYITFAIFGGFLAFLLAWELAGARASLMKRIGALLIVAAAGGLLALGALHQVKALGAYIKKNTPAADVQVALLENRTVIVLLYASIGLAALVILSLIWQIARENAHYEREQRLLAHAEGADDEVEDTYPLSTVERLDNIFSAPARAIHALHDRTDEERQPFAHLLLGIPWTQWFVAFVVAWMIFAGLYWELPTVGRSLGQGFVDGIGKGVWQGLYYWLQQQDVARGGQPIYYYFLLIPLYEQLAVVFGLAGIVYVAMRPTRFRIFLVWWFVTSLGIYSWAGEKMPWLTIHILLSLMLLAAIMLSVTLKQTWAGVQELARGFSNGASRPQISLKSGSAFASTAIAALLFVTMVHSMYLLTYRDPANGPLEMMVYVQTTPDVDTVMAKINAADQRLHGGRHQLNVVVGAGEEWPFYWYLRDYWMDPHPGTYMTIDPSSFQNMNPDVLILYPGSDVQAFFASHPKGYSQKEYALRSWFDESYKPQLACELHPGMQCPSNVDYALYGRGLGPWLSYGSNPPPNAKFNLGLAAPRLLNWLWYRKPLGATTGPYFDFVFIVRDGLNIKP